MKILCLAPVNGHTQEAIESSLAQFEAQNYEHKFLLLFDDLGNVAIEGGRQWATMSAKADDRANTSTKYNLMLNMYHELNNHCDAVAVWEPNTVYLPWHLRATVGVLASCSWSMPTITRSHAQGATRGRGAHPHGIATRLSHLVKVQGWPQVGEDRLWSSFVDALATDSPPGDPCRTHAASVVVRQPAMQVSGPIEQIRPMLCAPAKTIFRELTS